LQQGNEERVQAEVRQSLHEKVESILSRVQLYQYGLRGARGALLTAGLNDAGRSHFYQYSLTRDIDVEFPGARGFGFIRRVPVATEDLFVAKAQADGWPAFSIREINPNTGERYVIQYIEPAELNKEAIGLDIASEPNRYHAAHSSMQTGEVRLTGPITLVQATGKPQQAFLILMPLYLGAKTPVTIAEREQLAFGWSYAPLIMSEVLADQDLDPKLVLLTLSDATDPSNVINFFSNSDDHAAGLTPIAEQHQIFGRTWTFNYAVTPLFVENLHLQSPTHVLITGSAISILLALLAGLFDINQRNKQQLYEEQATLAAIVESSGDGIIGNTIDGYVNSWNLGAENIFGYSRDEAVGKKLIELIVPEEFWAEELSIFKRLAQGHSVPNFNARRRRKDGSFVDVSTTFSPIYDVTGNVTGVSKTVRDITEQKTAEAKIYQLNSQLESQVEQRTADLANLNLLFENVLSAATEFAIIATDLQGEIQLFNYGAERLLGYSAYEVVGKATPLMFHRPEELIVRANELSQEYQTTVSGFQVLIHKSTIAGADSSEWHYLHKSGHSFPVMLVVTTMRNADAEVIGYLCMATDITQQKRQQVALLATQEQLVTKTEQLTLAYEVAELGIWEWKLEDNSLQWNDKMYALYEQPITLRQLGLDYSHWESRVHPDDRASTAAVLKDAVAGVGSYQPTFRLILPSGKTRYIQAAASIQRNEAGEVLRVVGINRDITTEREIELNLRQAKAASDAASAAKSMFLANMSHEIRTPMNAVLGMLQLMKSTELSVQQDDYTSKAQIAAKSLLNLINDILDYSKIEAGKLELENSDFKLEELMQELAVVLSPSLNHKDVDLLFDIDADLPALIVGDKLRLQQVLINLASNAIKFTPKGEIIVRLQRMQVQNNLCKIRFSVTDSGIGINPEQQQRIFEGFTQAEASTSRKYGGSGLGLVISKRMIQMMGGELELQSELGHGSCFWFELAFEVATTSIAPASNPNRITSGMNVLVVDDNAVALDVLSKSVEQFGATVVKARSGADALVQYERCITNNQTIDAVLMDYQMPDMNGLDVAQAIKNKAGDGHVPVIVMVTAFRREEIMKDLDAEQAPYDAFLTKPVTPTQIHALLKNSISDQQPSRKTSVKVRPKASSRPLAGLQLLLVEDNEFNRQVASELLQNEGATVDIAIGGQEGIDCILAAKTHYDLVLMDVQMPDVDGLEATRQIRADARFDKLPIVAMTANVYASDHEACIQAGMNAHLAKPFDLGKVVETILLHTRQVDDKTLDEPSPAVSNRQIADDTQIMPTDVDSATTAQIQIQNTHLLAANPMHKTLESILKRFAGNEQFYRRIITSFETNLEQQLQTMQQVILQQNWSELRALLHTIKGTSGTIGLTSLYQMICDLETQFVKVQAEDVELCATHAANLAQQLRMAAQIELNSIHELLPDEIPKSPDNIENG
jgi:PAS domain S-box-containing protein